MVGLLSMIICIYIISYMLSAACCWYIDISIGVYKFMCSAFLTSPLEIVADTYIWHSHVEAHVLFVCVPFAQHFWALIIFPEWHYYSCAELPAFPIIWKLYDWQVLSPTDFFTPEIVLRADILADKFKTPVRQHDVGVATPIMIVKSVAGAFHAFNTILDMSACHHPVRDDFDLWRQEKCEILQTLAVFVWCDEFVFIPVKIWSDRIRAVEGAYSECPGNVRKVEIIAKCQHVGTCGFQIGVTDAPLESVNLLWRYIWFWKRRRWLPWLKA